MSCLFINSGGFTIHEKISVTPLFLCLYKDEITTKIKNIITIKNDSLSFHHRPIFPRSRRAHTPSYGDGWKIYQYKYLQALNSNKGEFELGLKYPLKTKRIVS